MEPESKDDTSGHKSELEEFLSAQQAEGEYKSSSSFSLDQLKAREKLGQFQLSESGLWLVKIVQAAVAGGASEIRLSFERRKVILSFELPTPWPVEEILQFVLSGTHPSDRAWQHLVTGLRACATTTAESLQWSCGDLSVCLDSSGSQVATQPYSTRFAVQATRPVRKFRWSSLLTAPLEHLARQTVEEWTAIVERCWPCPIPLTIDGRPLQTGYDAVPQRTMHRGVARRSTKLHFCLGWSPLFSTTSRPPLPDIGPPAKQEFEWDNTVTRTGTFLRWTPSKSSPVGAVAVHTSFMVKPTVDFISDGVVVESRLVDSWVSDAFLLTQPLLTPRFMFAVEPHELDLSGFAVRGIDTADLLASATPELQELADVIEAQLVHYSRPLLFQERGLLKSGIRTFQDRLKQL